MHEACTITKRKPTPVRRWIRRGFITWAIIATGWLANSVRTQGVHPSLLENSAAVSVVDDGMSIEFRPENHGGDTAIVFICGSGIGAEAYAPLLRPIAEAGYPVFVVRLPMRFAPLESHKQGAIDRVFSLMKGHPEISRWVVSGHSLGAAIACRVVEAEPSTIAGLVLLGSTHPKRADLSWCQFPVTKVYASNDGIAPSSKVIANKDLLPKSTKWVEIDGGNHSQFGHYGHQLFDGSATITRSDQQEIARSAMMDVVQDVAENRVEPTGL
ncbi:MAG: hypothetical protein JNL58_18850 [Planctomyces sp.]|nr:hypothetical protein [Planctomyces sp.]